MGIIGVKLVHEWHGQELMESNAQFSQWQEYQMTPLEGEVCTQYIRCGKPSCRCQSGQLHGPYHYRIWREGTSVRKVYVKSSELEAVKASCEAHRILAHRLRSVRQTRMRLTQSINKEWRRTQRFLEKPAPG